MNNIFPANQPKHNIFFCYSNCPKHYICTGTSSIYVIFPANHLKHNILYVLLITKHTMYLHTVYCPGMVYVYPISIVDNDAYVIPWYQLYASCQTAIVQNVDPNGGPVCGSQTVCVNVCVCRSVEPSIIYFCTLVLSDSLRSSKSLFNKCGFPSIRKKAS